MMFGREGKETEGTARSLNKKRGAVLAAVLLLVPALLFLARVLTPPVGEAVGSFDTRGLFYPWLEAARSSIWNGEFPLWDRLQFAGYPFLSNPQVGLFYPPTWLALLLPVNWGLSWHLAFHVWWAALGMWLFVRSRGASQLGAYLAAFSFAFGGFVASRIWAGHLGLLATNSWIPWLLLAFGWSANRRGYAAAVVSGIPFGLAILAGHTASLLYIMLLWLAYALFLVFSSHKIWHIARNLMLAVIVGLAISSVQLIPLIQFSLVSTRTSQASFESASAFSLPPAHLITLLIPEFFGEPTRAGYWSVPNFEELSYYAGILPLIALLLALRRPSRSTWFYVGVMATGILLALGSYGVLFPLAYKLLPIFQLTRAPARAAVLYTFAASALMGEISRTWRDHQTDDEGPGVLGFLSKVQVAAGLVGIAAIAATGATFAAQHPTDTSGRLWHQLGGWSLALLVAVAGIGLLKGVLGRSNRRWLFASGLAILSLVDLWTFGFKLIHLEPMAPAQMWLDAKRILGEPSGRVLPWGISIFEQNGAGQVGLASVYGYNALEVGANSAFAASVPDPRSTAYDILGANYVLAQVPLERYGDGARPLELVEQTEHVWIYERGRTLPMARLVYDAEIIADGSTATARIHEPDFDPSATVILDRSHDCDLSAGAVPAGSAQIMEERNGYWRIETNSSTPGFLVLSETAYPGWRATVSGERVEDYKAYTTVRAVCVPAGVHEVVWRYEPTIYLIGGAVSLLALLLVAMLVIALRRASD